MPKPSFGCMACRQRRVKCDERSGGCIRCERYRIRCPGYQHPLDVLLRHHGNTRTTSHIPSYIDSNIQTNGIENLEQRQHLMWSLKRSANTLLSSQSSLIRQPSIDLDQAALGAYYSTYCVSRSTICSLEHLRQQGNGCLWAAIKMLGLLQLHQTWQLPQSFDALLKQYTNATALLNAAIASPSESREDRTLLATLMLSVVEMKASPDFTLRYWLVHTNGAAALMEFRGADQILSRLGAALFFQISSQIVIYSILGRRYIPSALQNLRDMIRPYVISKEHPLWQWHGLMYRLANLWATAYMINTNLLVKDAQEIIAEALSIYDDMEIIFQSAGKYWKYVTQPSDEFHPLISHEHVYQSLLTTRVWNDRRTATILLFTVVIEVATHCHRRTKLDKDPQLYIRDAFAAIRDTALETLAAVPQMLASLKGKTFALKAPTSARDLGLCDSNSEYDEQVFQQTRKDLPVLPYMDSCRVQWAVYFAVQCEFVESTIRSHLLEVLESSGKIMQIQQWQVLAENVRSMLQKSNQVIPNSADSSRQASMYDQAS